jgi:hydroxymethylpyrimidine/phosphomethylpyrimidine kinase
MTPTAELRFVEREIGYSKTGNVTDFKTIRVLQQKWRHKDYPIVVDTEWRDVPLVKEGV